MAYNLKTQSGHYEVCIDSARQYGFFEHDIYGDESGGGLWFIKNSLVDYDGVAALPKDVIKAIRALGFIVPRSFE